MLWEVLQMLLGSHAQSKGTSMFFKWSIGILTCGLCLGWLIDHSSLTNKLDMAIANRRLANRQIELIDFNDDLIVPGENPDWGELIAPKLVQDRSSFRITFKILTSWEHWKATRQNRYIEFASTALGFLDCGSAQEFRERHLKISLNACFEFEAHEMKCLNRFIELALNLER